MFIPAHKKFVRGFTLIELLIVIAILGILAAAVLVAVNPAKRQNQAKDANTKADVGSIATALQAYYTSQGGTYPSAAQGLNQLVTNEDLKNLPTTPQGAAYTYAVTPGGCAGTAVSPCTDVSVLNALLDPAVAGNVWCFRSSTGKASEVAAAACTAP
ncbi:prepilin-type N-terminal cleavage/methylation domain-containing protein [Candidatus Curtissbacteria bacterium]|nr:prepilin-type N-terminal cleavage/methylation domain-containing protein [Candidatus Curtissbacteria bacterium]